MSDRIGRKKILVAGWIVGLPVPVLIMLGPSWTGSSLPTFCWAINQGLCWSTTVIMKIDLVGPARRGLAMGLNEFRRLCRGLTSRAGVGLHRRDLRAAPAAVLPGVAFALLGLLLSVFFRTRFGGHAREEATLLRARVSPSEARQPLFRTIFLNVSSKTEHSRPQARQA